jgi:hypothetical protein
MPVSALDVVQKQILMNYAMLCIKIQGELHQSGILEMCKNFVYKAIVVFSAAMV